MMNFTFITTIIGFMLAIQFQTIKQPVIRDTRDMWELREDLKKEQELQRQLLSEIRTYDETLESYREKRAGSREAILRETVDELKKEAGLTEARGQGLILTVDRFYDESYVGPLANTVPDDLLKRLMNELNMYGAKEVAISGQRIINTTVIRDINGVTKINNYPLNAFPVEIKVIADDVEKLYNHLKASALPDDFLIENLQLTVSQPVNMVVIPPYEDALRVQHMKIVKPEKEEK